MPARIQRRRTRGWRMPKYAVYVGRPTVFGNPFTVADAIADAPDLTVEQARVRCVGMFALWLAGEVVLPSPDAVDRRQSVLDELCRLQGLDLACWCPPGAACHADVLLDLAAEHAERSAASRSAARGLLI